LAREADTATMGAQEADITTTVADHEAVSIMAVQEVEMTTVAAITTADQAEAITTVVETTMAEAAAIMVVAITVAEEVDKEVNLFQYNYH
jgi:hypothetical protein